MSGNEARARRECARCHRVRRIEGRSLCRDCYVLERQAQTLDRWPMDRPNRQEQVAALLDEGLQPAAIARLIGCSRNAVQCAARRIRERAHATTSLADVFSIASPPEHPPCAGADPAIFEVGRKDYIDEALSYCDRCPAATRDWCVNVAVRPFESRWSGVAGGVLWVRGEASELSTGRAEVGCTSTAVLDGVAS